MFVSIYYKPSLFNAHTIILIVHIFLNVNKLCLNQAVPGVLTIQRSTRNLTESNLELPGPRESRANFVWRGVRAAQLRKEAGKSAPIVGRQRHLAVERHR